MKDDLTYLSQLAKKATKGRWVAVGCVVENENEKYPDICGAGYSTDYMTDDYQVNTDNIEYIAAAQPQMVLSLIAEIRRLRSLTNQTHKLTP